MSKSTRPPKPPEGLLDSKDSVLLLVDYQPEMFFAVRSADTQTVLNNVVGLAKAAKLFSVPTILATIAARTFSGPISEKLQDVSKDNTPLDRTNMNAWEDERVVRAVQKTRRKQLLIAGLWTEVCVLLPALHALKSGYRVYAVVDACGATSKLVEQVAIQRMVQAGVVPVTWLQVMLEWQRDWARPQTYDGVLEIAKDHAGSYGEGIVYYLTMVKKSKATNDSTKSREG